MYNVFNFEDAFFDKFIIDKAEQFNLPEEEIIFMIFDCFGYEDFSILNFADRQYAEHVIALQALNHNKRN